MLLRKSPRQTTRLLMLFSSVPEATVAAGGREISTRAHDDFELEVIYFCELDFSDSGKVSKAPGTPAVFLFQPETLSKALKTNVLVTCVTFFLVVKTKLMVVSMNTHHHSQLVRLRTGMSTISRAIVI